LKYSSKERKISGIIIVGAGDFNRVLISPNDTNTEKIMNDLIYLSKRPYFRIYIGISELTF
jgi:hypothetical protein